MGRWTQGFERARQQVPGDACDDDEQREDGHRDAGNPGLGRKGGIDRGCTGFGGGLQGFCCLKHPKMVPPRSLKGEFVTAPYPDMSDLLAASGSRQATPGPTR